MSETTNAQDSPTCASSEAIVTEIFGNGFAVEIDLTSQTDLPAYVEINDIVYWISFFYCEDEFMYGADAPCNELDIFKTTSDGSQGDYVATSDLGITGSLASFYSTYETAIECMQTSLGCTDAWGNTSLNLPEGWSMFGFTCLEPIDVIEAFSDLSEHIVIVKDYMGNAYLPDWGFNALGNLQYAQGYQIKLNQTIEGFQFCTTPSGGASQEELDEAYAEGVASVTPEDGVSQADLDVLQSQLEAANATISELQDQQGTQYPSDDHWYWNYVSECIDGNDAISCYEAAQYLIEYNTEDSDMPYEIMECVNGDDLYIAIEYYCPDALNYYPELLATYFGHSYTCNDETACNYGEEASCVFAETYLDCDGACVLDADADGICDEMEVAGCMDESSDFYNPNATDALPCILEIGAIYQGGYVFRINDDGTGLVADLNDLSDLYNYSNAVDVCESLTNGGYDDWYLPSIEELELMYSTIGQGADNVGNFLNDMYCSSTCYGSCTSEFWKYSFNNGGSYKTSLLYIGKVRAVRAF